MADSNPQCNIDTGDTTWVLVSTILVLGMMPALAFFEAGLLRSKNTLSLVTQIVGGLVVLGFLWDVFGKFSTVFENAHSRYYTGFTLTFGESNGGIIGNFDYIFL